MEIKIGDSVFIKGMPFGFTVASVHRDEDRMMEEEKDRLALLWWNSKEESINSINVAKALVSKERFV